MFSAASDRAFCFAAKIQNTLQKQGGKKLFALTIRKAIGKEPE